MPNIIKNITLFCLIFGFLAYIDSLAKHLAPAIYPDLEQNKGIIILTLIVYIVLKIYDEGGYKEEQ